MSINDESSNDEEYSYDESSEDEDDESSEGEAELSEDRLFAAVTSDDADAAAIVQQAIEDGANVNAVRNARSPLILACRRGHDQVIRILLDAGADARYRNGHCESAISEAYYYGHLSTVQLLINYDNSLLETVNGRDGWNTFVGAIQRQHSNIVRFLLDSGVDPHGNGKYFRPLMIAVGYTSLEIVRMLLDAGVNVEARDRDQKTALHHAASSGRIEIMRELIVQHNTNMFAVDRNGHTPFDAACYHLWRTGADIDRLLEVYGNKLTQDYGRLALHILMRAAVYSFAEDNWFHPPLNPLQIILRLGKLTLKHLRTLLHTMDPELIRNRDDTGKVPIHIACRTNAPVEVVALILELDPAVLHIADNTGALPIHLLCGTAAGTGYASVRYLVEQGSVGTLAARNRQGASPLHLLCGSTNPPLRVVQYLIQSSPESLAVQTNDGQYPFMIAAAVDSSSASLSVIYELVRGNPNMVVPR